MRHRRRHARQEQAELNITAFMNLMVVLVPFLLITAVFSRITILELNLPAAGEASAPPPEAGLGLTVSVREDALIVARRSGELKRWSVADGDYPLAALGELLGELKAQHPKEEGATLLLAPAVAYDSLVQVMDAVRLDAEGRELFPQIGIGELPGAAS